MNRQLLVLQFLLCLIVLPAMAQSVNELKVTIKGKAYILYTLDNSEAKNNLFLGFFDEVNGEWTAQTWTQELSWLVESKKAHLVVPQAGFPELTGDVLLSMVKTHFPHVGLDSIFFIAYSEGANKSCSLIKQGIPGILIAPDKSCNIGRPIPESAVSILNSRETDGAKVWRDSLERAGWWVEEKMVISNDPYYIDNHMNVISSQFAWVNMKYRQMNDTTQKIATTTNKIISPISDVVKQGKPIDITIDVAKHGNFKIKLLNLAAEPEYANDTFLGKGIHKFSIPTKDLSWGVYKLEIDGPECFQKNNVMIRG